MIGERFGRYDVVARLGEGGMGVVYRAEDVKLHRQVAIKVLRHDLIGDDDAKRRFMLEAQAASALDHPNICTIYEIDEAPDGQLFLVMAHYEGETLKAKIDRGPLKLDEALDYAVQIAQGLVKAHGVGIIHRDIKPANIFVTRDGLVKILDFGLARLHGESGITRTGMTLGTPAYMSPEQLLGSEVDVRSDLWSSGVLLYEMLSGQLPFRGEQPTVIAHAIAHATPTPLTAVRTGIPIELDRIVARALAKNPTDRYQTAADFLSELRRLKRESDGHQPSVVIPVDSRKARATIRFAYGSLAAAILAAVGYGMVQWLARESPIPTLINPVPVAATVALEGRPAWLPDGRMIAYQSDQTGKQDIWIAQVGGGPAINRTAAFDGDSHLPRWSPDGRQIVFFSSREGGGFYVMPALAGGARKVAPAGLASAAWSPDGSQLVYPRLDAGESRFEILDLRTNSTRSLTHSRRDAGWGPTDLAWSPDGRFIAFIPRNYSSQVTQLWVADVRDGTIWPITDGRAEDWTPSWTPDSRTLYFTSNRGGTRDLWRQRLDANGKPAGTAQQITTGLDTLQAAISPDGTRLVYAKGRKIANVWRVPIDVDRPATWTGALQLTFDQAEIEYLDLSPDGAQLAIQSDRAGNPDIWTLPAAGGEMQLVISDPTPDWHPAWSPDGRTLAFYSYRAGRRQVWVQPLAGGTPRQLTSQDTTHPAWSPDGTTIFVWGVRALPVAGGEPRQVPNANGGSPSVSPDGAWLAFNSHVDGEPRVFRVPVSGGPIQPVTRGAGVSPRWSPDGRWISFIRGDNISRIAPDGTSERPLTSLKGRRGFLGHFDADDRYIYFTWREDVSDIWVMDFDQKR